MSKKLFVVSIAILFAVSLFDFSAFAVKSDDNSFQMAKGGSSGGSRSSSSSSRSSGSSRSGSSSSKSSGWGGSSKSKGSSSSKSSGWGGSSKSDKSSSASSNKSSGWGGSSKSKSDSSTTKSNSIGWGGSKKSKEASVKASSKSLSGSRDSNKMSNSEKSADVAAYKSAVTKGTAFKTKAEAVDSFKKVADTKYTSKFEKEPTARPEYIPNDYSVGGKTVPITYNQMSGGYGYTDPITNAFILYSLASMASDSHRDVVMAKDGYYVGEPIKPSHGLIVAIMLIALVSFLVLKS